MRVVFATAVAAIVFFGACAPASPATTQQAMSPRSLARGATETFEDVWITSAKACIRSAMLRNAEEDVQKCESAMMPVRAQLEDTVASLDTWTPADVAALPCRMRDLIVGFDAASAALLHMGVQATDMLEEAIDLAKPMSMACKTPVAAAPVREPTAVHVEKDSKPKGISL